MYEKFYVRKKLTRTWEDSGTEYHPNSCLLGVIVQSVYGAGWYLNNFELWFYWFSGLVYFIVGVQCALVDGARVGRRPGFIIFIHILRLIRFQTQMTSYSLDRVCIIWENLGEGGGMCRTAVKWNCSMSFKWWYCLIKGFTRSTQYPRFSMWKFIILIMAAVWFSAPQTKNVIYLSIGI